MAVPRAARCAPWCHVATRRATDVAARLTVPSRATARPSGALVPGPARPPARPTSTSSLAAASARASFPIRRPTARPRVLSPRESLTTAALVNEQSPPWPATRLAHAGGRYESTPLNLWHTRLASARDVNQAHDDPSGGGGRRSAHRHRLLANHDAAGRAVTQCQSSAGHGPALDRENDGEARLQAAATAAAPVAVTPGAPTARFSALRASIRLSRISSAISGCSATYAQALSRPCAKRSPFHE